MKDRDAILRAYHHHGLSPEVFELARRTAARERLGPIFDLLTVGVAALLAVDPKTPPKVKSTLIRAVALRSAKMLLARGRGSSSAPS